MTIRRTAMAGAMLATMMAVSPALAADAVAGGIQFKQRCQMCHTVTPGAKPTLAPNLSGVAGRPAASTAYAYSAALKASKLKWDGPTLDAYLTAPGKLVPGTRMVIAVPDAAKRADVVAYLLTLRK